MNAVIRYAPFRALRDILSFGRKARALERHGWYRNIHGGWTHPHGMDYMAIWDILRYSPKELEYKAEHGSRSMMPDK